MKNNNNKIFSYVCFLVVVTFCSRFHVRNVLFNLMRLEGSATGQPPSSFTIPCYDINI